jgi:hypothetical protein
LFFDIGLAPPHDDRLEALAQTREVAIVDRPPPLVQFVEVAIEAEQRSQNFRIEILHDRVQLVDAVFDRRSRENECVARVQ